MNIYQAKSLKLLKRPTSLKTTGKYLLLAFFILTLFFAFVPWQQTAYGTGRVIAYDPSERQQSINAPLDGRLAKWYVKEGAVVKKGQLIVEIQDNDPALLANLEAQQEATLERYKIVNEMTEVANINVGRQRELYKKGVSARKSYEHAILAYNQYLSEKMSIKAELARMSVMIARQKSQQVAAPADGVILRRIAGESGIQVKAGEVIAELVPDTDSRAVEMIVNSNDLPLIRVGDTVRLQFEGWPAIQFSGWPSVAVGTFGAQVAVIDSAANNLGQFRLLIIPNAKEKWPEPQYLRQGVKAHGWVLLGRVPFWYELWRQFNGFPPSRVFSPPN